MGHCLATGQSLLHFTCNSVLSSPVYTTDDLQEALFSLDTLMLRLLASRMGAQAPGVYELLLSSLSPLAC